MPATPTKTAIIGTFLNSRNLQNDFLQVQDPSSGNIFAWIDYTGTFQGAFAGQGGGTGVQFVASLPATCFPGSTPSVQLSVAPYLIYYCSASNTWSPVGPTGTITGSTTPNHLTYAGGINSAADVAGSSVTGATGAISLTAGANTTLPLQINAHSSSQTSTLLDVAMNPISSTVDAPVTIRGFGTGKWSQGGGTALLHLIADAPAGQAPVGWFLSNIRSGISVNNAPLGALAAFCDDTGRCSITGGGADSNGDYGTIAWGLSGDITITNSENNNNIAANLTVKSSQTITSHDIFHISNATAVMSGFDHLGNIFWNGSTSGTAKIGVAAIAGAPNTLLLPTSTGTANQVLQTDGNNPQQLSWITVPTGSGTTGNLTGWSGTSTLGNVGTAPWTVSGNELDCTGQIDCAIFVSDASNDTNSFEPGGVSILSGTNNAQLILQPNLIQLNGTTSGNVTIKATATGGVATYSVNGGTAYSLPQVICFVTMALTTGTINSATRATNTASCPGLAALTDSISCSFNGDTNATTGYAPSVSGGLTLKVWASTNTVNVDQVNNTNASITPGSATLNCRVLR